MLKASSRMYTKSEHTVSTLDALIGEDNFATNPYIRDTDIREIDEDNFASSMNERKKVPFTSELCDDAESCHQSMNEVTNDNNGTDENIRCLNREELDSYDYLLRASVENAGRNAFGIAAIEVWMWDNSDGMLKCVTGAQWFDTALKLDQHEYLSKLFKLEDDLDEYLPPTPVIQGVGVTGTLFAKEKGNLSRSASWHDLVKLEMDQIGSKCERLTILKDFFDSAKGIYFENCGTGAAGIVVYFTRHTADEEKLSTKTDHNYLWATANLLGSIVSWNQPRIDAGKEIDEVVELGKAALARALMKMKIARFFTENVQKKNLSTCMKLFLKVRTNIKSYVAKFKGGEYQIPPGMMCSQVIFVFFGCLSSLLTLSLTNEAIKSRSDAKLNMILVPLGALVSCHYGLTSAPATQPRNVVFGSTISSVTAIASTYIPPNVLPIWLRNAIVPAVTITTTLKLGVVHPPAGSMAVLFASQAEAGWVDFVLLIFGYVMATIYAAVFINLYDGNVYPVYWGFPKIHKWFNWICKRGDGINAKDRG